MTDQCLKRVSVYHGARLIDTLALVYSSHGLCREERLYEWFHCGGMGYFLHGRKRSSVACIVHAALEL